MWKCWNILTTGKDKARQIMLEVAESKVYFGFAVLTNSMLSTYREVRRCGCCVKAWYNGLQNEWRHGMMKWMHVFSILGKACDIVCGVEFDSGITLSTSGVESGHFVPVYYETKSDGSCSELLTWIEQKPLFSPGVYFQVQISLYK